MNLIGIICGVFELLLIFGVAWICLLIADKLALLLHLWGERRRDERIMRRFQEEKDKLKDVDPKDTTTLDKIFKNVERVEDFSDAFRKP